VTEPESSTSDIHGFGDQLGGKSIVIELRSPKEPTTATEPKSANAQTVQADEYLTIAEVADRLKLSRRTIWRWCKSGRLPAVKVGHQWRITQHNLEEFIRRNGKLSSMGTV
jgi:excisionase family DNA binding protein